MLRRMDNGYTPASVIMDAPIEVVSGGQVWRPENYGGEFNGPSTLRSGIEHSRNLMTVRLANDLGMNIVAEYAERFGIYDKMLALLAMSLGSGETTVLRMVSAYSVIANGGKQIKPTLIDRIQDRYGKTIFRHEERLCDSCNAGDWQNQEEPNIVDNREQVLDPMTAYQITSMMQGVITARHCCRQDRPRPARRGRQDRHHQRREGCLVRRLHARPRGRPLHGLRQSGAAWPRRYGRRPLRLRSSTNSCRQPSRRCRNRNSSSRRA